MDGGVLRRRFLAVAAGSAAGISGLLGAGYYCVVGGFVGALLGVYARSGRLWSVLSAEGFEEALLGGVIALGVWLLGVVAVRLVAGLAILVLIAVLFMLASTVFAGRPAGEGA